MGASRPGRRRLTVRAARWAALGPALALFAIPFLALIQQTRLAGFRPAYGDWHSVYVSVTLSVWAMLLIVLAGTPLSVWLARTRSWSGRAVETLALFSLLTPSLATGILLVSAYGPYSTIGDALGRAGVSLDNNAASFVLAQVYGGLAYFVLSARTAFEHVPPVLEEAAQDLGCTAWRMFWLITLPLAFRDLVTGGIVTWVRMIGEFGIAAVFSYFPQGVPVKLYVNLQNDGVQSVYVLVWILLALTLPFAAIATAWLRRQEGRYS
ncbi:sulfate ABC transporter permease [Burkholderia sp. WAC0059]|uniref:molybdate ABC transporter permease subunit n=1 Tax=Burkholderia sp. WAC0059 TaxID=2066022 RepID=UPI000C7EFE9C|nr:ABC transporter permease subunit [Burkholderia sp. WAC0059]PLZ02861.1 sulfate ABC transporter permease [Burkholderia sp. WAC0059]